MSESVPFPARVDVRSVTLTGIFLLALLYTLYVARAFVVPVIVALLLSFVFRPLVRWLRRFHVAEGLSAAAILLVLSTAAGTALYSLTGPAAGWMAQAPAVARKVEVKLRGLLHPLRTISQTADRVEALADGSPTGQTQKVEVRTPGLRELLYGGTQSLAGFVMVVAVLLYFLLASGDLFLTKLVKVLPRLTDKKRAVQIARETEDQVSAYLATITLMNGLFGLAVGVALHLLGMPNPVLWGVLAGLTNYVPYVGSLAMAAILFLVALLQFDLARAGVVAGIFLALNFVEGYIATPKLLGRRLALNPVVVFTGVFFWGWLWGVAGALLAVPILATLKIVCDRIDELSPVGEFLGD